MSLTIAYVFYMIPRSFNFRILSHKSMHADLGVESDSGFFNITTDETER